VTRFVPGQEVNLIDGPSNSIIDACLHPVELTIGVSNELCQRGALGHKPAALGGTSGIGRQRLPRIPEIAQRLINMNLD
jgi:hypothetical protein